MKFENILKHIFTTLVGIVLMAYAVAGYILSLLETWPAIGCLAIGFVLMFMTDDLVPFFRKVFELVLDFFRTKFNIKSKNDETK